MSSDAVVEASCPAVNTMLPTAEIVLSEAGLRRPESGRRGRDGRRVLDPGIVRSHALTMWGARETMLIRLRA